MHIYTSLALTVLFVPNSLESRGQNRAPGLESTGVAHICPTVMGGDLHLPDCNGGGSHLPDYNGGDLHLPDCNGGGSHLPDCNGGDLHLPDCFWGDCTLQTTSGGACNMQGYLAHKKPPPPRTLQ